MLNELSDFDFLKYKFKNTINVGSMNIGQSFGEIALTQCTPR